MLIAPLMLPLRGFAFAAIEGDRELLSSSSTSIAIGTLVGLSAIGISSPVAEEIINIGPQQAAISEALFALFNGLSRPLFGWLSDRYRPRYVAIASYVLMLIACQMMLTAQSGQVITYLIAFCLFWFCLGGGRAMASPSGPSVPSWAGTSGVAARSVRAARPSGRSPEGESKGGPGRSRRGAIKRGLRRPRRPAKRRRRRRA